MQHLRGIAQCAPPQASPLQITVAASHIDEWKAVPYVKPGTVLASIITHIVVPGSYHSYSVTHAFYTPQNTSDARNYLGLYPYTYTYTHSCIRI